jgi:NAD(P)-dependent dehydrogenase (short-subunit alcohol dehydrogenase family)
MKSECWPGGVLITGANSPLGRSLVKLFLDKGCNVSAVIRDSTDFHELSSLSSQIEVFIADLSVEAQLETLIDTFEKRNENLGGFIHCAARPDGKACDVFSVNVFSGWRLAEALINSSKKRPRARVSILFVGSVGHKFGGKEESWGYSSSKYLLEYFPKFLRRCAADGVTVNCLRLGVFRGNTQVRMGLTEEEILKREHLIPTKRMASVGEVARFIISTFFNKEIDYLHNSVVSFTGGE